MASPYQSWPWTQAAKPLGGRKGVADPVDALEALTPSWSSLLFTYLSKCPSQNAPRLDAVWQKPTSSSKGIGEHRSCTVQWLWISSTSCVAGFSSSFHISTVIVQKNWDLTPRIVIRQLKVTLRVGSSIHCAIKAQKSRQDPLISRGLRSYTVTAERQDLLLNCLS